MTEDDSVDESLEIVQCPGLPAGFTLWGRRKDRGKGPFILTDGNGDRVPGSHPSKAAAITAAVHLLENTKTGSTPPTPGNPTTSFGRR